MGAVGAVARANPPLGPSKSWSGLFCLKKLFKLTLVSLVGAGGGVYYTVSGCACVQGCFKAQSLKVRRHEQVAEACDGACCHVSCPGGMLGASMLGACESSCSAEERHRMAGIDVCLELLRIRACK